MILKQLFAKTKSNEIIDALLEHYEHGGTHNELLDLRKDYLGSLKQIKSLKPTYEHNTKLTLCVAPVIDTHDSLRHYDVCGMEEGNVQYNIALEYLDWSEWLGLRVLPEQFTNITVAEYLAHVLFEMTFCGFNEEHIKVEREELEKELIKAIESFEDKDVSREFDLKLFKEELKLCKAHLDKYIIKQDNVKKLISTIITNYAHDLSNDNVLILGSTGSGKSYTVKKALEFYDIPSVTVDCSKLQSTSYSGEDLNGPLKDLYNKMEGTSDYGVLYLDEFDKLVSTNQHANGYKLMVQKEILSLLQGEEMKISVDSEKITATSETVMFDTSKILIIMSGAFTGLDEVKKAGIGFGSTKEEEIVLGTEIINKLKGYGIIPELLGRIRNITKTNELTKEDLIDILKKSEDSILVQKTKQLEKLAVKLVISPEAYEKIAQITTDNKLNARGLNLVANELFKDIVYDIAHGDYKKAKLNADLKIKLS